MGERKQPLLSRHNIIISAFVVFFFFFFFPLPPAVLINMQVRWRRHQKSFPVHRVGLTMGSVVRGYWEQRPRTPVQVHARVLFFFAFFSRRPQIHLSPAGSDELLVLGLPQQTCLIGQRVALENAAKNNPRVASETFYYGVQ